ncbi:MAG: MnhB domain-containing protein [Pseudothermotoga sp.]|uniref:MnhB domain-containing protein n=1 Tax=Pseudothermotoga sp. TaxID=2033661 RepID=UPI0025826C40|nr:MnhB domain-containing protein [Pseudothermotoga sp.]MDI6862569.1 MnhB domain-containing protein [Pseudothermotoga sp.]
MVKILLTIACVTVIAVGILNVDLLDDVKANEIVERIHLETNSPNTVTGVYLSTRLYDTLFEILVFAVASTGVVLSSVWLRVVFSSSFIPWKSIEPTFSPRLVSVQEKFYISDPLTEVGVKLFAYVSMFAGFYLALFGHRSPGGGFAAGVAGATGLLLGAIVHEIEETIEELEVITPFERLVLFFVFLTAMLDLGEILPLRIPRSFLLSAGYIPIYNILIFAKVTFGSWAILRSFIRHRGIL